MRIFSALALVSLLAAGCTPYIPVKPAFGVSALTPTDTIPPEFAEFNSYDPQVGTLLADQICATPYEIEVEKSLEAVPGEIVSAAGRCRRYVIPLPDLGGDPEPAPATAP